VGIYIGTKPVGQTAISTIGAPLKWVKRTIVGDRAILNDGVIDRLLERIVDGEGVGNLAFIGDPNPDFVGIQLKSASLASALPRDVTPKQNPTSLRELLTVTPLRTIPTVLREHTVASHQEYFVHSFDFGWTKAKFFSESSEINDCISVIVPGSGFDQSVQVIERRGYHGTLIDEFPCQALVYIRPNNSVRQIVYEGGRADFAYLYSTLIAMNSIYSYWYLQELIETVSALKADGKFVIIGGISQGGAAATWVGAVTDADVTVILSGIYDFTEGVLTNQHQIHIPGIMQFSNLESIGWQFVNRDVVISFGKNDLPLFRHEAQFRTVCMAFSRHVVRLQCLIHDGGHTYPPNLKEALNNALSGRHTD
jgi:hypothetical protein